MSSTCSTCKQDKPSEEFSFKEKARQRRHTICKSCHKRYRHDHYRVHHLKYKAKARRWGRANALNVAYHKIKKHFDGGYPAFKAQVEELRIKQSNRCAICNRHESEFRTRLCVDHCHTTGRLRGLLCSRCNTVLGRFADSAMLFQKAAKYLAL